MEHTASRRRSQSASDCSSTSSPRLAFSSSGVSTAASSPHTSPPQPFSDASQSTTSFDYSSSSSSSTLFDTLRTNHPRSDLLEHLAEIFFDRLGCQLPFLQKDVILGRIRSFTLPDHVSNGIAALAARCDFFLKKTVIISHVIFYRFSDKAELFMPNSPKWAAGEPFLHKAKVGGYR
jgi:hypothetical protein